VVSQYDACEMELVKQREVFTSLGDLPSIVVKMWLWPYSN